MPIAPGPCLAYSERWGWEEGECKKFVYGGCQGNENKFGSKEQCEQSCKSVDVNN